MPIMPGAEPFLLPGGDHGVLLLHGFTGSPAEMRPAGEYLHSLGYTVLGPLLAGHGTEPADMARTGWPQWYADAVNGYHLLGGFCRTVCVAGLSMGGILALKLAAEYPLDKIAVINAPVFFLDKRLPLLPVYRLFRAYEDKGPPAVKTVNYQVMPLACLASLLDLIRLVKPQLPAIGVPALVIQSKNDPTVRPDSASYIYQNLGSAAKRLVWLERSGHIATLDSEHRQVFQYLDEFFATSDTAEGDRK